MTPTNRIAVPHSLTKDEVRTRLRTRLGDLPRYIPGGAATVESDWAGEDVMNLSVTAMGQRVAARLEVEDRQVVVHLQLPPMLSFLSGAIEGGLKDAGQKLLK